MRSTGSSRSSSALAFTPSAEADRIALRPLPIPGIGLATRRDLLRQLEIRLGTGAVGIVVGYRQPVTRGLAHPDIAGNDRLEHQVGEMRAHFPLDVLPEPGAS